MHVCKGLCFVAFPEHTQKTSIHVDASAVTNFLSPVSWVHFRETHIGVLRRMSTNNGDDQLLRRFTTWGVTDFGVHQPPWRKAARLSKGVRRFTPAADIKHVVGTYRRRGTGRSAHFGRTTNLTMPSLQRYHVRVTHKCVVHTLLQVSRPSAFSNPYDSNAVCKRMLHT